MARQVAKNKRIPTWMHTFVCLSNTEQDYTAVGQEQAELQLAGLGEKQITFNAYADAHDIYYELHAQYP